MFLMVLAMLSSVVYAAERIDVTDSFNNVQFFEMGEKDEIKLHNIFDGTHVLGIDKIRTEGSKPGIDFKLFSFADDSDKRYPVAYMSIALEGEVLRVDVNRDMVDDIVIDVISVKKIENMSRATIAIRDLTAEERAPDEKKYLDEDKEIIDSVELTGAGVVDYAKVKTLDIRQYARYIIGILIALIALLGIYKYSSKKKVVYFP